MRSKTAGRVANIRQLSNCTSRQHRLPRRAIPFVVCTQQVRRYATVNPGRVDPRFYIGQPTHESHPHQLKAGELTRGISAAEYAQRRNKLAERLPNGSIAVLPGATLLYRSGPVFHEFHQQPDFYYLTGLNEPDALCVIEKTGDGAEHIFHLAVRPKDVASEKWDGPRCGVSGARDIFNADEAYDIGEKSKLTSLFQSANAIYTIDAPNLKSKSSKFTQFFSSDSSSESKSTIGGIDIGSTKIKQLSSIMHSLRITKSVAEVVCMRQAGRISGRAFNETLERRFKQEAHLWAFLEYQFKLGGCEKPAYVPVIAGGKNALQIHYTRNDDLLKQGELVLVDAGGQYGGYVTDITRTWPINGKFTDAQRDLYQAVLDVQKKCVSLCRTDSNKSLDDLHEIAENDLYASMRDLGFAITRSDLTRILFPHHLGHYIGLDIHDSASHGRVAKLKSGQCVTIEPGIYVPDDDRWPKHFRNIGIRIEDSICVSDDGPINLSANAAKEIVDIEGLAAEE